MRAVHFLPLLLASTAFAAEGDLELKPAASKILAKNTTLECRMKDQPNFGFLFERGDSESVHVSVINDNKNEGEKTAFNADIIDNNFETIYLKHFHRWEKYGTYFEFMIIPRKSAELDGQLPAKFMVTSSVFSKNEKGVEEEQLIPDNLTLMACKVPAKN